MADLAEQPVFNPNDPLPIARAFVGEGFEWEGEQTLYHQSGQFFQWNGACYLPADKETIRSDLYAYLAGALKPGKKEGDREAFRPSRRQVDDVMDALKAEVNLSRDISAPAWLDGNDDIPAQELLACRNGLLSIRHRELIGPSPHFWTHNALDFDHDPDALDPNRWLEFLNSVWKDDPGSIEALQEVFGYLLTPDTLMQKIFMLVGPKRSGKGTIARVLTELLGKNNVVSPTLASMSGEFGIAPLIGKQAAIIPDARMGGRKDHQLQIGERLLSISGEDGQTINRKFLPAWSGRLSTSFLMLTNEIPSIAEASGALASRFIVLRMTESFYDREDHGLTKRLLGELPEILNWSLDGLDRLLERGHFKQPESALDALQQLEALSSPISAFIRDPCEVAPMHQANVDDVYDAWNDWCEEQGMKYPGNKASFGRDLNSAVPSLGKSQHRENGKRVRAYSGIGLKE